MRVKLFYTVEDDDVLPEAAKILGLAGDSLKQVIETFQSVQTNLSADNDPPNTALSLKMLDDMRKALLTLDGRAMEVVDIIQAYEDYRLKVRTEDESTDTPTSAVGAPDDE